MATGADKKQIFKTVLLTAGKTATGIKVPSEIIEKFEAGKNLRSR